MDVTGPNKGLNFGDAPDVTVVVVVVTVVAESSDFETAPESVKMNSQQLGLISADIQLLYFPISYSSNKRGNSKQSRVVSGTEYSPTTLLSEDTAFRNGRKFQNDLCEAVI